MWKAFRFGRIPPESPPFTFPFPSPIRVPATSSCNTLRAIHLLISGISIKTRPCQPDSASWRLGPNDQRNFTSPRTLVPVPCSSQSRITCLRFWWTHEAHTEKWVLPPSQTILLVAHSSTPPSNLAPKIRLRLSSVNVDPDWRSSIFEKAVARLHGGAHHFTLRVNRTTNRLLSTHPLPHHSLPWMLLHSGSETASTFRRGALHNK